MFLNVVACCVFGVCALGFRFIPFVFLIVSALCCVFVWRDCVNIASVFLFVAVVFVCFRCFWLWCSIIVFAAAECIR